MQHLDIEGQVFYLNILKNALEIKKNHLHFYNLGLKMKKILKIILFIILTTVLFIMFNNVRHHAKTNTLYNVMETRLETSQMTVSTRHEPKMILIVNGWDRFNYLPDGDRFFKEAKCQVKECVISNNINNISEASAVIFLASQFRGKGKEVKNRSFFPKKRRQDQYWIFADNETPHSTVSLLNLKDVDGIFNWTMTYHPDSDVYWPYGGVIPLESRSGDKFRSRPRQFNMTIQSFRNKRTVAWFVSHCNTISKREKYVKELQKHIPVDIYGQCQPHSNYTCPDLKRKPLSLYDTMHHVYCLEMLESKYKFYLGFENAFCPHYVTEKVFNILEYDIIPIVMGLNNYSKILPPKSYIDIMDFDSPKHLAVYLKHLSGNETKYLEYFEWKYSYKIITTEMSRNITFCELCKKLQQPHMKPNVYKKLSDIINPKHCKPNQMQSLLKRVVA